MLTLVYPKRQSIALSNKLFQLYEEAKNTEEEIICFDLRNTTSLTPFGISMLALTILVSLKNGKNIEYIVPNDRKLNKFFIDIGFHNLWRPDRLTDSKDLNKLQFFGKQWN